MEPHFSPSVVFLRFPRIIVDELVCAFFRFSFFIRFSIIDFIHICNQDNAMSDLNARLLAQRIDTVLDILVAGDYHSAIHNLEI